MFGVLCFRLRRESIFGKGDQLVSIQMGAGADARVGCTSPVPRVIVQQQIYLFFSPVLHQSPSASLVLNP
jgi:hypothetical protein